MTSKTESLQGDSLKRRASLVGALINILQTIIKISFGIVGQSTALIVDGLHSLSDLLSDILVIIAVRMGSRSADGDHPYGHRRFETIATGVLGISLVVMSASIVWHVVEHLNDPSSLPRPEKLTLFVAGVSIVLNEWLYHYTKGIAKRTRSKLLLANAWHQRSDALSSLVVLFGIVGVLLGYPIADAVAAIIVALMVAKIGVGLVFESIKELVDTALPSAMVVNIRNTIMTVPGVEGIHLLRTRQMGEDSYIDAHIVVDPRITVSEGHFIGDAVRDELVSKFDDVLDVLVHVDPEDDERVAQIRKLFTRAEMEIVLGQYFSGIPIEHIHLHYLNGAIEVEVIFPFSVCQYPAQLASVYKQCALIDEEMAWCIRQISVFFKGAYSV